MSSSRTTKLKAFNNVVETFIRELLRQYPEISHSPGFMETYNRKSHANLKSDYFLKWFSKQSEEFYDDLIHKRSNDNCQLFPYINFKFIWNNIRLKKNDSFWKHVQFIMLLGYQYQLDNEWIVNKLQSQNNNNNMDVAEKEKLMAWLLYIQNINTKQEQLVFILRNNNKIL